MAMRIISPIEFEKIYEDAVEGVYKCWTPQMQWEMSRHCYPWSPNRFNLKTYLQASSLRYYMAYRSFGQKANGMRVCDIGGFLGVFPITLKNIGYQVALTESLRYYGSAFDELFGYLTGQGVRIIDYDPFDPGPVPGQYDIVTVMAILEHYPHSLERFMINITSMTEPTGNLYIEVPNIAYWPKRMNLLLGRSPLVALKDIYQSETPFIGHHHEFTISELRLLADLSNIEIVEELYYTYSIEGGGLKRFLRYPMDTVIQTIFPNTRECLAIFCRKKKSVIVKND